MTLRVRIIKDEHYASETWQNTPEKMDPGYTAAELCTLRSEYHTQWQKCPLNVLLWKPLYLPPFSTILWSCSVWFFNWWSLELDLLESCLCRHINLYQCLFVNGAIGVFHSWDSSQLFFLSTFPCTHSGQGDCTHCFSEFYMSLSLKSRERHVKDCAQYTICQGCYNILFIN